MKRAMYILFLACCLLLSQSAMSSGEQINNVEFGALYPNVGGVDVWVSGTVNGTPTGPILTQLAPATPNYNAIYAMILSAKITGKQPMRVDIDNMDSKKIVGVVMH